MKQRRTRKPRPQRLQYFLIHKPYGVLCQFSDAEGRPTLHSLGNFPSDVYPVGRLDMDSEGLVFLSNDKILNEALLHPARKREKEYFALVEGIPSENSLRQLCEGVMLEGRVTLPARASVVRQPDWITARVPELRLKPSLSYSWIQLIITEGRNRQVRRMCAAAGHPVVRLIRYRIAEWTLNGLSPGAYREMYNVRVRQ